MNHNRLIFPQMFFLFHIHFYDSQLSRKGGKPPEILKSAAATDSANTFNLIFWVWVYCTPPTLVTAIAPAGNVDYVQIQACRNTIRIK